MKLRTKLLTLLLGITPLFLSACSLFGTNENFFNPNFQRPALTSSQIPILSLLKGYNAQPQGLNFSLPDYRSNQTAFDFISGRTIGITASIEETSRSDAKVLLVSGTATILGAADQATAMGNGYSYYVSTNAHVANHFNENFIVNSNSNVSQQITGFWFTYNQLLNNYLPNKQTYPDQAALTNQKNDNLVSNFLIDDDDLTNNGLIWNQNNLNVWSFPSTPTYWNNPNNAYYPTFINQQTFWIANDISVNDPLVINSSDNSSSKLSGSYNDHTVEVKRSSWSSFHSPQKQEYNFAADFAIMKIDFKPTFELAQRYKNHRVLNFLTNLQSSIKKYGDLAITDNVNVQAQSYLTGFPATWKNEVTNSNDPSRVVTVSLKLNSSLKSEQFPLYNGTISRNDLNNQLLTINQKQYWTPTTNYAVDFLNLGPGSSGSLLINYDPTQTDPKKQFSTSGIYWGVISNKTTSANVNQQLANSTGFITRFIVPGNYDLIGSPEKKITNTPTKNSFCSYLIQQNKSDDSLRLPNFCT